MISIALKRVLLNQTKLQLVLPTQLNLGRQLTGLASSQLLQDTNNVRYSNSTMGSRINMVLHRNIYDSSVADLDSLERLQQTSRSWTDREKERRVARTQKYIETRDTGYLIVEDLINLISMADCEQHLDLIEQFMELMKDQLYFAGWSTMVMRLYYKMNQVDRAFKNVTNLDKFGQSFNSFTSYRILCTMLFNAGRYEEVVKIYHMAAELLPEMRPAGLGLIALASLAKSEAPDALEQAQQILNSLETCNMGSYYITRSRALGAYIAINQAQYGTALNIIYNNSVRALAGKRRHYSLKQLKTVCLIKMNRYEDLVVHLKEIIKRGPQGKGVISRPHYELIEEMVSEIEDDQIQEELINILTEIKNKNIFLDGSLESVLFEPIIITRTNSYERNLNDPTSRNKGDRPKYQKKFFRDHQDNFDNQSLNSNEPSYSNRNNNFQNNRGKRYEENRSNWQQDRRQFKSFSNDEERN